MAQDIYDRLGVPRLINAAGTLTSLGGSRLRPSAAEAMISASTAFVDLAELNQQAGKAIAGWLGVEAVCITAGAAAGMVLAAAACMAGRDGFQQSQLPAALPRHRIIIQCCHRAPFERALRIPGAELVEVGDAIETRPADLQGAIDDSTAAVAHFLQADMLDASLPLSQVIELAHARQVPVIVDAAAELPPRSNLWTLAQGGADLVIFSGGKDIRGPQNSGLLLGRSDLVEAALAQSAPFEHVVGRPMKVTKEVIAGLFAALEEYLQEDEDGCFAAWEALYQEIEAGLRQVEALEVQRFRPCQPRIQPAHVPRLEVRFKAGSPWTVPKLVRALREGSPPIAVQPAGEAFWINTHTLEPEEGRLVVHRIQELLADKSRET